MDKTKILLLICLYFLACQASLGAGPERGVSKELSLQRSEVLSAISYDLSFQIPADVKSSVTGSATISFTLSKKVDVVLDFQGTLTGRCIVNGKKTAVAVQDEHIIIPQQSVMPGVNSVKLKFTSLDKALNRSADYLYTLFVPDQARSCFPCFDQPDLRATFTTQLDVPKGWKTLVSHGSNPIPTYLYSFVAGQFAEQKAQRGKHSLRLLYRDASPGRTAQTGKIMDEASLSLQWMEAYTGIDYPFGEFAMVALPGYQFGGMEHPGAIQLSDRRIFLGESPSQDEELSRMELIAHETAHQWFGDIVSMKWFEDVWTKEVFANFMASKISREQFQSTNHDLAFLKNYHAKAVATDRTDGTHPIVQELPNLNRASLLYDAIIYDKAPVMMRVLEDLMGTDELKEGLRRYLDKYTFKSASWDDLIDMLDRQSPEAQVRQFSDVWVKQKGLPTIHTTYKDGKLIIRQTDPLGRHIWWRQKFQMRLIFDMGTSQTLDVDMYKPAVAYTIKGKPSTIIPNYDGRGYGRFTLDNEYTRKLPLRLMITRDEVSRYALLLTLYDNYLMGLLPASYFSELYRDLAQERNPLIMSTIIDQMISISADLAPQERRTLELCILDVLKENKSADCRQLVIRKLSSTASAPEALAMIEDIWQRQNDPLFNEHDYMAMAYRLALMHPERWQDIVDKQRRQLKTASTKEEFDYVSRACNPDGESRKELFNSLLLPQNRQREPWAIQTLALLCSDVFETQSNVYITSSLASLEYLQKTSDIFFTANWLNALLGNRRSESALYEVNTFMNSHPEMQEHLRNRVRVAAWPLKNYYERKQKTK